MFIISEISPQFGGVTEVAEQMILQSKMGGADAIKVQLYTAKQFGQERAYLEMTYDQLKHLKNYADKLNIALFATAFDHERLDWCLDLKLPYLKVAARMHKEFADLTNRIMDQKIPTFVSIPSDYDVKSVKIFDHAIYLHCIVKYPTLVHEFEMPNFKNSIFKGISDHTLGNSCALFASAHGATYLEKHYTLKKSFQFETEKAHLGAMDMQDLIELKNTAREFERIRKYQNL